MKKLNAIASLFVVLSTSAILSFIVGALLAVYFVVPQYTIVFTGILFLISLFTPARPKGKLYVAFTEGICEKVQQSLIEIMGSRTPSLMRTPVGYLQALTSPQNMAGMSTVRIDPGDGKIKQVRIKFIKRATSDIVRFTKPENCNPTVEPVPFEKVVEITNYVGTEVIKFSQAEMRKLCEPDGQYMAAQIAAHIDPVMKEFNKKLITEQAANFGNFPGTSSNAVRSYQFLDATNHNAPIVDAEVSMMEDVADMDLPDRPIVIGAHNISKYVKHVGIGCCNDLGQDVGEMGAFDFFRDRYVGPILGDADDFILMMPGHNQLLTFNEYVGEEYVKENDVFSHSTFVDPWTGLTFDQKWHYDDCFDYFTAQFGFWYELFVMPANAFAYGDELAGVNFTLHYRATAA